MDSRNGATHRWIVLAVVCLCAYVINLDITIVNGVLPTLARELHATNRDLQWVVDSYNLTFATFVLPAGALADRFGRRGGLMAGLALFAAGTAAGSLATNISALITARAVMGLGAAAIFPATLSIISAVFPHRAERARAIALWAAVTGAGIGTGPLAGGALLEKFWWGSVFAYMAPVALLALGLVWWLIPTSRDPDTPALDLVGLGLSAGSVGTLIWTVIEAPHHGWNSPTTLLGLGAAAVLLAAFVVWERRHPTPMIDVSMFGDLRFASACASVTIGWFCLLGFILMITQYFQYLKNYSPFGYGASIAPVAASVAIGSVLGILGVHRVGTRAVITTGLLLLAIFFGWVTTVDPHTQYWPTIVAQMMFLGLGLGFTTAPATETIMDVVPTAKAALGSAVNDATRELGGTLGIAVIGSVFASAYTHSLNDSGAVAGLPAGAADTARQSAGQALQYAQGHHLPGLASSTLDAFASGLHAGCAVAAGVALTGALFAACTLPTGRIRGVLGTAEDTYAGPVAEPVG
jgi:EmrB/QacA subfamily drug resistance transporter